MTNIDYKKKFKPKQALAEMMEIIKNYDNLYNILEENGWKDGYADWTDKKRPI